MEYMTKIKEIHLETVYRVMMKRIAKGYSAEQLSFLIGQPDEYVAGVEMFQAPDYPIAMLKRIARALEERSFMDFFPPVDDGETVMVQMESMNYGFKIVYACGVITPDGNKELRFILEEKFDIEADIDEIGLLAVRFAISLLIRHGYFCKPRLPLEVFLTINKFLKKTVNPDHIKEILNELCKVKSELALTQIKRANKGCLYLGTSLLAHERD